MIKKLQKSQTGMREITWLMNWKAIKRIWEDRNGRDDRRRDDTFRGNWDEFPGKKPNGRVTTYNGRRYIFVFVCVYCILLICSFTKWLKSIIFFKGKCVRMLMWFFWIEEGDWLLEKIGKIIVNKLFLLIWHYMAIDKDGGGE